LGSGAKKLSAKGSGTDPACFRTATLARSAFAKTAGDATLPLSAAAEDLAIEATTLYRVMVSLKILRQIPRCRLLFWHDLLLRL
jgi:hypothetical protein